MSHTTINKTVSIAAPIETVYECLTSEQHILKYFPYKTVKSDWVVGGQITFTGELGDQPFTDSGRIITLDGPSRFAYRYWSTNHGTEQSEDNELIITYDLAQLWNGCEVTVTHDRFQSVAMYHIMSDAWEGLLGELRFYAEQLEQQNK